MQTRTRKSHYRQYELYNSGPAQLTKPYLRCNVVILSLVCLKHNLETFQLRDCSNFWSCSSFVKSLADWNHFHLTRSLTNLQMPDEKNKKRNSKSSLTADPPLSPPWYYFDYKNTKKKKTKTIVIDWYCHRKFSRCCVFSVCLFSVFTPTWLGTRSRGIILFPW